MPKCKNCKVGKPYIHNPKKKVECLGRILSAGKERKCAIFIVKAIKESKYLMKEFIDKMHYKLKWMTGKDVIKNNKAVKELKIEPAKGDNDGKTNSDIPKQSGIVQRLSKVFLFGQNKKGK